MKIFYIKSQKPLRSDELEVVRRFCPTFETLNDRLVSIRLEPGRLGEINAALSTVNPNLRIKPNFSLCGIEEDEETVFEDEDGGDVLRSLTDPSEYIGDRRRVPLELFEHLDFFMVSSSSSSSTDVVDFFKQFLCLSRVSPEIVILVHTPSDVQALYGFSCTDVHKKIRQRLLMRKRLYIARNPQFSQVDVSMKYVSNRKDVVSFIQQFYREIVLAEGVPMEAIAEIAHARSPYLPSNLTACTRKTKQEVDMDDRAKVMEFVEKINHAVPIHEQIRTNFKLDEDTIASLIFNRVFMISERVFLRSNRRIIQQEIDLNIKNFKASETESAKADRVRVAREERLALAATFVQKIQRYCDERIDDTGFCNLKSAYTHKILKVMEYEEIITEDDMLQGLSVKDDIDAILSTRVEENNSKNKGDVQKAVKVAKKLVEIFHTKLIDFEFDEFNKEPRKFVELNVLDSDHPFSIEDFRVFCRHSDTVMWHIQEYHSKVVTAIEQFIEASRSERSVDARKQEEDKFKELQRQKVILSDILTDRAKLRERKVQKYGKRYGDTFQQKMEVYKQNPDDPSLTSEDIKIVQDSICLEDSLAELFVIHDVESIDELQDKDRLLQRITEFKFDLTPFTPGADEIREHVRKEIETILDDNSIITPARS